MACSVAAPKAAGDSHYSSARQRFTNNLMILAGLPTKHSIAPVTSRAIASANHLRECTQTADSYTVKTICKKYIC